MQAQGTEKTCQCGCGEEVTLGRRFSWGHWARTQLPKDRGKPPKCLCGCGQSVKWRGATRGGWSKYASSCRNRKPPSPAWIDDDPRFWDWFAGFVDGEAYFGVTVKRGRPAYLQPIFAIALRADERPILEEMQRRLGCGRVCVHMPTSATSNLQLKLVISAGADCERLVQVLMAHPLRAKKLRDFRVWAAFVRAKASGAPQDELWALKDELVEGRKYNKEFEEVVLK